MRSQNTLAYISFSLAILLSQLGFTASVSAIPNPIDNGGRRDRRTAQLPTAPTNPPPTNGERTPGGGLGEDVCPVTPQPLTAITPEPVHGKTLAARPTLWFYMPYTMGDIEKGEFSILTADELDRVYKAEFTLPDQPGLVSVTMPEAAMVSLDADQRYRWYLKVNCVAENTVKNNLNINGWIDRMASTPELEQQVADSSPEIWYDTVHQLADCLSTTQCETRSQIWAELLESVDLTQFTQTPMVGPLVLTDS